MSAQGNYRFYSVLRQTILLVHGEPLGRERVKTYVANFLVTSIHYKNQLVLYFILHILISNLTP